MEVHFTPDVQAKLEQIARESGRPADKLVQDAVAGFVDELAGTREIKGGRVKPIDGEAFFEALRQREDELLKPS